MADFSPYNSWLQAFQATNRAISSGARFASGLLEADRLSWYSKGIAARDEARSKYNQTLLDRTWPDLVGGGPDNRRLGEITQEEIDTDHKGMVEAQRTWILQNVRNRRAQEQLLQELEPWAAANYSQVLDMYRSQRMIEMKVTSDRIIKGYQADNSLDMQGKIDAINAQYDRDVAARIRWADDAAIEKVKRKEEIQGTYAMAGALDAAKKAGWKMAAADQWIDENTHFWDNDPQQKLALRNVVEDRVASWQREETRLNNLHDDEIDIRLAEAYRKAVDSIEGLRTLRNRLGPEGSDVFILEGRQKRWTDDITYRLNYLEERARVEAGARAGPDLDKIDDRDTMTEWLLIQDALSEQRTLAFSPRHGPANARTLAEGQIPSPDDAKSYLLHNYGGYISPEGVAKPRLRTSYVESTMKEIGGQIIPNLRDATAILWAATKPTKEQPRPPLSRAEAGDMAAALRTGFYQGRFSEADLPDIAARWAFNKAISKSVSSNLPLSQAALGGAGTTDTTEQYINDVANHWFTEWRDRPGAGALETVMDQHARQMMDRVQQYTGKPPTKYWIQADGEIWIWYANPDAPTDDRRGELYRFIPSTVNASHQYADAAPKLQVFTETDMDWRTLTDQRPLSTRGAARAAGAPETEAGAGTVQAKADIAGLTAQLAKDEQLLAQMDSSSFVAESDKETIRKRIQDVRSKIKRLGGSVPVPGARPAANTGLQ